MYYNDFKYLKLSGLGLGCMRLPCIDGDDSRPDPAAVQEMVDCAMANGINYYDTAWGYHDGNSEIVIGEALKKYDRSSFYLASKFPGYDLSNFGRHEEIFYKQLEKCQTDYFDFYLYHNVCELNIEFFGEKKTLSDDDIAILLTAAHYETTGKSAGTVPCTGCKYCMSKCPMELEIPRILELYNEHSYSEGGFIAPMALANWEADKLPSACIGCGACAAVCPQQIDIPGTMKKFVGMLAKED